MYEKIFVKKVICCLLFFVLIECKFGLFVMGYGVLGWIGIVLVLRCIDIEIV